MLPSSSLRRRRPLAVAALLLLAVVACDEAVACDESAAAPTVRQDMQGAYGIDTHDSTQVGGAIASGETLGNKEASDGLTVSGLTRPRDHEYEGDHSEPGAAIEAYKEALRWEEDPRDRFWILNKLSRAYSDAAEGPGSRGWKEEMEAAARTTALAAARAAGRIAVAPGGGYKVPDHESDWLLRAADSYRDAGRLEAACEVHRRRARGFSFYKLPKWCLTPEEQRELGALEDRYLPGRQ